MSNPANVSGESNGDQESIDRRAWSPAKQLRIAGITIAAAVVLIMGVWLGGRYVGRHEPLPSATLSPPGTFRATSQQLKSLAVEPVALHGFVSEEFTEGKIALNTDRATPLFSPYSGRVTRVIAGPGDTVQSGAALATMDASEFVQAQNDLRIAASQAKIARINETRKHALYDAKGGSLQDWQQAQADLGAAEAALAAVRNRLKIFGKSDADIDALETSRFMNPTAVLAAPIGGVVVDRQVGPGQYLQAGGATPVFTIADPTSVWLLANVREADASLIHVGQAVEVHVLAYPNREFKARVSHVAALVDPATHRLPVRAELDNRDGALKPEMFATFRFLTGEPSQAPAVPEAAVVYEGDLAHVWVLSAGQLLAFRAIRIGRKNDGLVEVLDGLKPGEKIVTRGAIFIDQAAVPASS